MAAAAVVAQQQVSKAQGKSSPGKSAQNERDKAFANASAPSGSGDDSVYQPASQADEMHDKYLEDRRRELEQKGWGPMEKLARSLGWVPKKRFGDERPDDVRLWVQQLEAQNKGIIDPKTSGFIGNWDLITLTLLLFTVLITPYEVCFLSATTQITPLFIVNRIVDGCFIFDMYIQFNLSYIASIEDGGHWVINRRKIRSHYYASWFWIDLIAVLPIWIINYIIEEPDIAVATAEYVTAAAEATLNPTLANNMTAASAKSATDMLQILRMVRLLRLIKITRIIKAARIFQRFETNMEITYGALGMAKLMIFLFTWSHLQSCFWGLVPDLTGEDYSWIDALQEGSDRPLSPWDLYIAGLYFSIMTVTSIGYGEMLPVNTSERLICSVLMLFSSIVWCYVMGQACSIAATMDPHSIEFKGHMDSLNEFMRDRGLPKTLKVALRTFFHNSRYLQKVQGQGQLIEMMSPLMQSTVALQANKAWLDQIWYLRAPWYAVSDAENMHSAFVACVAQKMVACAMIGQERVAGGLLCIVQRGLAIKRWRFISKNKFWGEDMILDQSHLIDYSEAVAMTYLELFTLDRPSLDVVCKTFPECGKRVRAAARRMLIQRLVITAMRDLAGLPPPKSFVLPIGQTHALPPISLEQKVDILIDSSQVARFKLKSVEGVDDDADQGMAAPPSMAPAPSSPVPPPAAPAGAPASGFLPFFSGKEVVQEKPTDPSGGEDPKAVGESFDRLVAMYQDVAALQAAMGEELQRLSGSMGKSGRGAKPLMRNQGLSITPPPPSNRGRPPLKLTVPEAALPRSAPGALRQIPEEDGDQPWMQSARKFLPPWAQPSPSDMSA